MPANWPAELSKLFETPTRAFELFDWLRQTFNGDLFPMDDPGAERSRLGEDHLSLVRDFVDGRSLVDGSGQGRLFKFRFEAIPVDLISPIYQQFARSSAEDEAHIQGLHYTPIELVHLTLDPVFERLTPDARIIDPTCGSGAFLVEAFRRLVWRNCAGGPATRAVVRDILYHRLFGIDINRSALGIAAFSLYLAALEFDEEPVADLADLTFDRLIGATLFQADTIGDELPAAVTNAPFDAVVGNPPWTFDSRNSTRSRVRGEARSRRSPDQAFLKVAADLAGDKGRVGMVMKASPFFSRDEHAVAARNLLLKTLAPAAIVNLSALRREDLFPDAVGPALLFFARCALLPDADYVLLGSVPWTADFRRNGVFHIGPEELRAVPLTRILRAPAMLKAATFGTARDGWLIERLERDFPTFEQMLIAIDRPSLSSRGQGFQVRGAPNIPPAEFYSLNVLTPDNYTPFWIDSVALDRFAHETLHRPRDANIYRGPLLLCPKGTFKAAAELGRYSSAVHSGDMLYTENFYGVSFKQADPRWAYVLNAILNSSVTTFQLAFAGGAWGLERSTVEPKDLLSLRIPDLSHVDPALLNAVIDAEAASAARPSDANALLQLDTVVANLYDLDRDELTLARDSIARARMLIFEGRKERRKFVASSPRSALSDYAESTVQVVNGFLRARGERHLEATIYSRPLFRANWTEGSSGLMAIKFSMSAGAPSEVPVVHLSDGPGLDFIGRALARAVAG